MWTYSLIPLAGIAVFVATRYFDVKRYSKMAYLMVKPTSSIKFVNKVAELTVDLDGHEYKFYLPKTRPHPGLHIVLHRKDQADIEITPYPGTRLTVTPEMLGGISASIFKDEEFVKKVSSHEHIH